MNVQAFRTNTKRLLPEWLVKRWLEQREPNRLLLTFDDGPSPDVTLQVLERLERHGARAVFFVVGRRVEEAPHVVDAILRGGHLIGNHTYGHDNTAEPAFVEYLAELRRCQDVIAQRGPTPWLFRPPRGHLSIACLIASRIVGLRLIHWSLNVRDWACRTHDEAVAAADQFDRQVKSGQIALLHDNNPCVVEILDIILPRLKARGFDLSSGLDELRAD